MRASCRELLRSAAFIMLITPTAPMRAAAQAGGETPTYMIPAGWLRSTNAANGVSSFAPPNLQAGAQCVLTIVPVQLSNATADAFHAETVRQAASYGRVLEPPTHESVGAFLVTTLHQFVPPGIQAWVRIYTVRWNDRGEVLMFSVNSPELSRIYLPVIDEMVRTTRMPQVARGVVTIPGTISSSAQLSTERGVTTTDTRAAAAIAGLYSYTTMRYDALSNSSVLDQYWYLFSPEGRVCRGYRLPKLPPGSNGDLHRFDFTATSNADPENCGTFEMHGDEITMRIGRKYPESIVFRAPDRNGKVMIQRASYSLSRRW